MVPYRFSDVSGTNSFPILRACWWYHTNFPTFRELTPSPSSGYACYNIPIFRRFGNYFIFKVRWWYHTAFPTFRELNPSHFQGVLVVPHHSHTLKMWKELVPETSENLHILKRQSARENFIEFRRHETFKN